MSYIRTPEHRALRAELIRRWKPWEKSTGPRTLEGKKKAAMRGYKGAERILMRQVAKALRSQKVEMIECHNKRKDNKG
jgi:hypothetical protein